MSTYVVDVLYIKMIEKTIHRKLNAEEMEAISFGEPIFVQNRHGTWMSFRVPFHSFPYDLMPKDTDARAIEEKSENGNIFDFAFTVGPLLKVSNG
jgi:hypothetical protein